jgi:hypothetical protein
MWFEALRVRHNCSNVNEYALFLAAVRVHKLILACLLHALPITLIYSFRYYCKSLLI